MSMRPFNAVPVTLETPLPEWRSFDSPAQHPAPLKDASLVPPGWAGNGQPPEQPAADPGAE